MDSFSSDYVPFHPYAGVIVDFLQDKFNLKPKTRVPKPDDVISIEDYAKRHNVKRLYTKFDSITNYGCGSTKR